MAIPPPDMRTMRDFDPSEPAVLHERLTDSVVTWTGDEAQAFREAAIVHPDGSVEWNGYLFDGWGNVLGG